MMRRWLLVGVLACVQTGCLHTTYTTGRPRGGNRQSGSNNVFLWGLVHTAVTDLTYECPDGVAKFTVYKSFGDGLLEFITLGIYTPRSWEADCAAGGRETLAPPSAPEREDNP